MPGFAAVELALEDTDPYRNCHHWDVADRLDDGARSSIVRKASWSAFI